MSDDSSNVVPIVSRAGRLADALARARVREQGRACYVLAAREGRLEALADDLRELADELPLGESSRFSLIPARDGDRLTVDSASFVDLHPETLDYRLVRERRDGPDVVAEASDRDTMADHVADYIADRIVERDGLTTQPVAKSTTSAQPAPRKSGGFWKGLWLFVLGGVCSATALFTYAWLAAGPTG